MRGKFQSFLAHPDGKLFNNLSEFFRRIVAYSPSPAPFYEPMYRSGRYLAFSQGWDRFRSGNQTIKELVERFRDFRAKYLIALWTVALSFGCASVGKVRIAAVKKVSRELVERYPDKFSTNYEANKIALSTLVDARTKRLRNRIVGYVTRLKIVEGKRTAAPGEIGSEGSDDDA